MIGARIRRYVGIWRLRRRFVVHSYEETVQKLYSHIHSYEWNDSISAREKLSATRFFADELEIDFEALSVIHIAGTKGKGSTSAMVERILYHHGFSTGLFTSPHLVDPRERFRINGEIISKPLFVESFWHVHNMLQQNKDVANSISFFAFLTLLSLHIFQREGVNVAIMEAGIGGRWDSTNIIPFPMVTGITRIDLDHCKLLGDTIGKIAKDKAGIIKANTPIFVTDQGNDAMASFQEEATSKKVDLQSIPSLLSLVDSGKLPPIGLVGDHQYENASLAVALSHSWLDQRNKRNLLPIEFNNLPQPTLEGLRKATFPCRGQTVKISQNVQVYFDIAHTPISVNSSARHFHSISEGHDRILVFNCANERDPVDLMLQISDHCPSFSHFLTCPFDFAKPSCGHWTEEELCEKHDICIGDFKPDAPSKWHTWLCQFADAIFQIPKAQNKAFMSAEDMVKFVINHANITERKTSIYCIGSAYLCGNVLEHLEAHNILELDKIL